MFLAQGLIYSQEHPSLQEQPSLQEYSAQVLEKSTLLIRE